MKKTTLILVGLGASVGMAMNAAPLTPAEALQRSRLSSPAKVQGMADSSPVLAATVRHEGTPAIYIFNKADNKGFMVLSADDTSVPVLGYCDQGQIPTDASQMPDGLSYWLQCLAEDVSLNASAGGKVFVKPTAQTAKASIAPLIHTKWNQDAPYNNKCPKVGSKATYTGCVATAFAQVLNYYNKQVKGTGTYSYTWQNQTLSFNYGATTFDWDNMLDSYSGSYSQAQADAVATLMYACGVSVDMSYGTNASGAVTAKAAEALSRNFGFAEGARAFSRVNYHLEDWNNLVYDQMKEFGPLLYAGHNTLSGHAFVCDGYENGYYHFNWGWGGSSDGYFLLTALNPGSQGIGGSISGYSQTQQFIGNVTVTPKPLQPSFGMNNPFELSPLSGTAGITEITVSGFPTNQSGYTLKSGSCQLGLQLKPASGNGETKYSTGYSIGELKPRYGYKQYTVKIPITVPDGTYIVTPAFKTVSDGKWHDIQMVIGIKYPYYTLVKSGLKYTLTAGASAELTVKSFTLDTPVFTNTKFATTAEVSNNTKAEYLNNLYAIFVDGNDIIVAQSMGYPLDLLAGDNATIRIESALYTDDGSVPTGNYQLYLCEENGDGYNAIAGPIAVTIQSAAPAPTLKLNSLSIAARQPADNVVINCEVECTAGYYFNSIVMAVFHNSQNIYQVDSEQIAIGNLSGSQSVNGLATKAQLSYTADLSMLDEGTTVRAGIFMRTSSGYKQLGNSKSFTIGRPTAVDTVVDDVVVSREYVSLQGVRFSEKPSVPGMYILRETLSSGRTETRRVMIR